MNLKAFKDALVAIYDADSAVQAITGRSSFNLMPRGAQVDDDKLPLATYFILDSHEAYGASGHALVDVRIEAWVKLNTNDLQQNLETLIDRAETLFNGPTLATESIDTSVNPVGRRRDGPAADGVRSLIRDFRFDLTV